MNINPQIRLLDLGCHLRVLGIESANRLIDASPIEVTLFVDRVNKRVHRRGIVHLCRILVQLKVINHYDIDAGMQHSYIMRHKIGPIYA